MRKTSVADRKCAATATAYSRTAHAAIHAHKKVNLTFWSTFGCTCGLLFSEKVHTCRHRICRPARASLPCVGELRQPNSPHKIQKHRHYYWYAAGLKHKATYLTGIFVPEGYAQPGVVWHSLRFASPTCIGPIRPQLLIFTVPALCFRQLDVVLVRNRRGTRREGPCEARAWASCHARQKPVVA